MANENFDLIFGQTSPLTPYEWADADYLEGWNTVGSTPPARTMFDALQRQNDLKMQTLNNDIKTINRRNNIQRGLTYAVGDIAAVDEMPSYLRAECVTAGTTAATVPAAWSSATAGGYVTDGTAVFVVDDIRDGTPVGRVIFDSILRPGYVRANGATITSASVNYPRLVAYLQANPSMLAVDAAAQAANVGLFLYNSSTDTLTMANYIDRVKQGGTALASVEAGLPEISAFVSAYGNPFYLANGAFSLGSTTAQRAVAGTNGQSSNELSFAASRSDSIYGGANTVQPPAIVSIPQIRY